jgi:hypothetical protein
VTAPTFGALCQCGHPQTRHIKGYGRCQSKTCFCIEFAAENPGALMGYKLLAVGLRANRVGGMVKLQLGGIPFTSRLAGSFILAGGPFF